MRKINLHFSIFFLLFFIRCGSVQTIEIDYSQVISKGPDYFGWEGGWISEDSLVFLERYRLAPPNLIRIQVPMFLFEPVNDNTNPDSSEIRFNIDAVYDIQYGKHTNYDEFLKRLVREYPGIIINLNIWDCANWLASTPGTFMGGISGAFPPNDYSEYEEFVRSLAFWLSDSIGLDPENILLTFVNEPNALASFPTHAFTGTVDDLVLMAQHARSALDQVSPDIRMGGIEEYMSSSMTNSFMNAGGDQYVDFLTFHVYGNGASSINQRISNIVNDLSTYQIPIYLTEMGDQAYGPSIFINYNSLDAGIDLTRNLIQIWKSDLTGFSMFRLNNTYIDNPFYGLSGWIGYGLFEDWRGTNTNGVAYAIFPGYWGFANFYTFLDSTQVLASVNSSSEIEVIAAKKADSLFLLAVNLNETFSQSLDITLINTGSNVFNHFQVINPLESLQIIDSGFINLNNFHYQLPEKSARLFRIREKIITGIHSEGQSEVFTSSQLNLSVFPNPFNNLSTIQFNLDHPQKILLKLYNCRGQCVLNADEGFLSQGKHRKILKGNNLSSGVYYLQISGTLFSSTQKILLLK